MDVESGLVSSQDSIGRNDEPISTTSDLQQVTETDDEVTIVVDEFMSQYYNDIRNELGTPVQYNAFYHSMALVGDEWWWMSYDHPVAQMLRGNGYESTGLFSGQCGCVVVYPDEVVHRCINDMVTLCRKYGWEVIN